MTEQQEYSAYPRMIYQKGGGYTVVASEEEEKGLKGEWSRDPSPEAFSQFSPHHTTRIPVNDPSARVESQQSQQSQQLRDLDYIVEAVIRRLQDRDLLRRPPGRPPGSSRHTTDEE
jgi:hypothetical protein